MSWLFRNHVVVFIMIIIFLILQLSLLYPSMISSLTFRFISVPLSTNNDTPPRLAYLISGLPGDGESLKRILQAIYHPNNFYIVHLCRAASDDEHRELFTYINNHVVFSAIGNVKMIDNPNVVSENGPTKIASVLHAAAILVKGGGKWDWFINLDATSYPLVTQDDLLSVLSKMPRHLNFIDHTRQPIWFQGENMSEIMVVDQGLYMSEGGVSVLSEKREVPYFRVFTGSSMMALTRPFVEYCLWGWDNFPRTLLMYLANSVSSAETYFQTVICSTEEFSDTVVNTDLHFTARDDEGYPRSIKNDDLGHIWASYAPFARKFNGSAANRVLDLIDEYLLFRRPDMLVPGGWCAGTNDGDRCVRVGGVTDFKPGLRAISLQRLFDQLVQNGTVLSPQCNIFR